jgi:hypothetical protein
MAKVHRRYQYTWWEDRFQQKGLFQPVTITEHGWIFSNSVIHENDEEIVKLNADQQLRWLRATLVKMEEAKAAAYTIDGLWLDDTTPYYRNMQAERVYAAALGVTPRKFMISQHDYREVTNDLE